LLCPRRPLCVEVGRGLDVNCQWLCGSCVGGSECFRILFCVAVLCVCLTPRVQGLSVARALLSALARVRAPPPFLPRPSPRQ